VIDQRLPGNDGGAGESPIAAGQKAAQNIGVAEAGSDNGSKTGKKGKGKKGSKGGCNLF
jgi:hypothetical protein